MITTIARLVISFFAQAIVIFYPGIFVFWFVFHTRIERWRSIGKRAYFYATFGWPVLSVILLILRRTIFQVQWPTPWWAIGIGVLALALAAVVGAQAAQKISRRTLVGLVELEPQRNPEGVLRSGIYAKSRNPVYLAHWLVILAAAALSGYAANWVFLAVDTALLGILVRVEERELLARYGAEFGDYMRAVPRFIPKW